MDEVTVFGGHIPTFDQLSRVAPAALIALLIAAVGYFAAVHLAKKHIADLKEWIKTLRKDE